MRFPLESHFAQLLVGVVPVFVARVAELGMLVPFTLVVLVSAAGISAATIAAVAGIPVAGTCVTN
jgi:uncharacterized membrane protein